MPAHDLVSHILIHPDGVVSGHTHGLLAWDGHPEMEIVAPWPDRRVAAALAHAVSIVLRGERLLSGHRYHHLRLDGGPVHVALAGDEYGAGGPVLRLLHPDDAGVLSACTCQPGYQAQYLGVDPATLAPPGAN